MEGGCGTETSSKFSFVGEMPSSSLKLPGTRRRTRWAVCGRDSGLAGGFVSSPSIVDGVQGGVASQGGPDIRQQADARRGFVCCFCLVFSLPFLGRGKARGTISKCMRCVVSYGYGVVLYCVVCSFWEPLRRDSNSCSRRRVSGHEGDVAQGRRRRGCRNNKAERAEISNRSGRR